jgi:uracil-DNA glycosylase
MDKLKVDMHESWLAHLGGEFSRPYMLSLRQFLREELKKKKIIYPHGKNIFQAFNTAPFDKVKVVIIGQDPYHGVGQAHGLSFSVNKGVPLPPSLLNIYKELESDLGIPPASHGYLLSWAQQGVLLLNSVLTVEQGKAASHQGRGWEEFTDKVVEILNEKASGIVFVLWGSSAQKKGAMLDQKKHLVLKTVHPSPLSSYRGFFGCKHFSKINAYLRKTGKTEIDWCLEK